MSTTMRFYLAPDELQFEAGGDYPAVRKTKLIQVQDRTAGGTLQVETLGVSTSTREINFNLTSKTDYDALVNWFVNVVNGGEKVFSFTDEYDYTADARITDDILDFAETSLNRYSGTINLEYV